MRGKRRGQWAAIALAAAALGGCAQIFGIDEWTPAEAGAPPGEDATGAQGASGAGSGGPASGAAGGDSAPACVGTGIEQIPGDCRALLCELGAVILVPDPSDQPDDGLDCTEDGCQGGTPVHTPRAAGAGCTGGLCDGGGACVECLDGEQCPSGVCEAFACAQPSCHDGVHNGDESDLDCGGGCKGCEQGQACDSGGDCKKGGCDGGVCEDD